MKSADERIAIAVEIATDAIGIDGSHHKQWALDQVVRTLLGKKAYAKLVEEYEDGGGYEWDEGIAP